MSTDPLTTTPEAALDTALAARRIVGAAGLIALVTFAAAVLVTPNSDLTTQAQLETFLEDNGLRQAAAWLLMLLMGLTWLVFVVGLRRVLPASHGRDLFTAAALVGQAATWAGASLNTAAAPANAHGLTLPVYQAFGEAGHLAVATGTAATGLALVGLARAAINTGLWSTTISRGTSIAGVVLILAAVIGPVSVPVYALWLLTISVLLLRSHTASPHTPAQ